MALRLTGLVEGRELAHRWWAEREAERNLQGARGSAQHLEQADRGFLATLRSVHVRQVGALHEGVWAGKHSPASAFSFAGIIVAARRCARRVLFVR